MKNLSKTKLMSKPFQSVKGLPDSTMEHIWIEGLINQLDSDRERLDKLLNHEHDEKSSVLDSIFHFDFKKDESLQQDKNNQ